MTHISSNSVSLLYLFASVLFILAIKGLSSPSSARTGSIFGIVGMIIAIATTLYTQHFSNLLNIFCAVAIGGVIGAVIALKIKMTAMPQLVAAFHSLVGAAAVLIAASILYSPSGFGLEVAGKLKTASSIESAIGAIIGAITFSASIIAFLKLQGILRSKAILIMGRNIITLSLLITMIYFLVDLVITLNPISFWIMVAIATIIGILIIIPIGGADMPVVISILNSYSGWAAVGIGFTLNNTLLIITGALVGASGAILSYVMCKAMNRSIMNVIFAGINNSSETFVNDNDVEQLQPTNKGNSADAAFIMQNAETVIIVPGYGMAVSGAQHALKEMVTLLENKGVKIRYAIHPVAGRMPGHMNVLLAEANVPYEQVFELDEINREFDETDVAFVIGANDITNPAANSDKNSPIYGMPVLDVEKARKVLFVKRGMASGYAGVDNPLFYKDKTIMLFGDAKTMCEDIIKALK